MLREKLYKPYDKISVIYEDLMQHVDYNKWANYLLTIAHEFVDKNSSLLEIASGGCFVAEIFSKNYPNIIATDYCLPMLQLSRLKRLPKICCDMRYLPFQTSFDFIFCAFDSINYLLNKKEISVLFHSISSLLKSNGAFTFDISLENNSLEFRKEKYIEGRNNGYRYKRISKYSRRSKIHKNIFYIFDSSGKRYKEIHKQKIYSLEFFYSLLKEEGFEVTACYDAFSFNPGDSESERVQLIARKKTL